MVWIDEQGSCLKCRGAIRRDGRDSRGVQRWKCKSCDLRFSAGAGRKWGQKKKDGNFSRAIELIESGLTIRATQRQLRAEGFGADANMVQLARTLANIPRCACGDLSGHKQWCAPRFASSPKRQAFMKRWHNANSTEPSNETTQRNPKLQALISQWINDRAGAQ